MQHLVGYTQNNIGVYADLINSDAAKHIAHDPRLLTLAAEALQHISLGVAISTVEYDMERIIGYDFVVATTDADVIFYAQLVRDSAYTRFIKSGKPTSTSCLSLLLCHDQNESVYSLSDVWVGRLVPPKPGTEQETNAGNVYWEDHAFIFDHQPIQARTITKKRPY